MVEFEGEQPRLKDIFRNRTLRDSVPDSELEYYRKLTPKVVEFVKSLDFKPPGSGIFMYGMNGAGKSYIAAATANTIGDLYGVRTRRASVNQVLSEYFEGWEIPELYRQVECLVLEELNKEIPSSKGRSEAVVEDLLKDRFEKGRVTLITTNSTIEAIERRYGATVVSVLKGRCLPLKFPEVDLREFQNAAVKGGHDD